MIFANFKVKLKVLNRYEPKTMYDRKKPYVCKTELILYNIFRFTCPVFMLLHNFKLTWTRISKDTLFVFSLFTIQMVLGGLQELFTWKNVQYNKNNLNLEFILALNICYFVPPVCKILVKEKEILNCKDFFVIKVKRILA